MGAYDTVSQLYPHVPPLLLWRAWEYAAYQRFALAEPVLDIGCGDGRYFRLVWPNVQHVVGIDMDEGVAVAARQSGVYQTVYATPADQSQIPSGIFGSAFANCALEHMDRLDNVLSEICRSLRPGGTFLLSVVTDKLIEWSALPQIASLLGAPERAQTLQDDYTGYHHLVNPLSADGWAEHLQLAGFDVLEYIPIVPELSGRLFLLLDQFWHVKRAQGEIGDTLHPYLAGFPQFPRAFKQIIAGFLDLERDWSVGCGAVFLAQRRI